MKRDEEGKDEEGRGRDEEGDGVEGRDAHRESGMKTIFGSCQMSYLHYKKEAPPTTTPSSQTQNKINKKKVF